MSFLRKHGFALNRKETVMSKDPVGVCVRGMCLATCIMVMGLCAVSAKAQMAQPSDAMPVTALAQPAEMPGALETTAGSYYDNFVYCYNMYADYYNSYASSGSLMDLAYRYYYYARAGYYYYAYYGYYDYANEWLDSYMDYAQYYYDQYNNYAYYYEDYYSIALDYYYSYLSSGSQYDLAYAYYNYASAMYYYCLCYGDSNSAIYYYNLYMGYYYDLL